ncbi:hypothetical protein [Microbacterium gorillae]|uniref:hypothetical protein n=1 Tax=Microbacterium gorillae TaxID=1231063 RepID=UPI0011434B9D|nr:hypothetical protein [Microbacterium gorillae]
MTVSRAVLAYTGRERSAFPRADVDAVRVLATEVGADATRLIAAVQDLVAECDAVQVDWSQHDLRSAGDHLARVMTARHPELDAEAIAALRWAFTYSWR